MAVSVGSSGGSGRRKSLDAEINLVSFIDLLSMCICFLLMTAVWLEVGSVQVKQSHGTEAAAASNSYELDLKFQGATRAQVIIKKSGRVAHKMNLSAGTAAELAQRLDAGIGTWLASVPGVDVSAAMLTPNSAVSYGELVGVMDVLRRHKIVNLGVVPVAKGS